MALLSPSARLIRILEAYPESLERLMRFLADLEAARDGSVPNAGSGAAAKPSSDGREIKANQWRDQPPLLVFAACYLGQTEDEATWSSDWIDGSVGFGHAAISAGVGNFVGSIIPAPDDRRSVRFARVFYEHFFAGRVASQAIHLARQDSFAKRRDGDLTHLRYILLGDPFSAMPHSELHRSELNL